MTVIYHLTSKSEWEVARTQPEYRAESLALEGFIHCSKDHVQVLEVANRLYASRNDLLVLEVETDQLTSPLKHEASRSGEVYPHIYGALNSEAVVGVLYLVKGGDGKFNRMEVF